MKALIDLLSNFIEITGNTTADAVIVSCICFVSFMVAFGVVGIIFDALGVYDSDIMSNAHWTIRVLVFLALSFLLMELAKLIKKLFSFQWWIYLIAGILVLGVILVVSIIKHKIMKKKAALALPVESEIRKVSAIDRDRCPRCGARLVKRQGRFGEFYGCENFYVNNCRYTRKYK